MPYAPAVNTDVSIGVVSTLSGGARPAGLRIPLSSGIPSAVRKMSPRRPRSSLTIDVGAHQFAVAPRLRSHLDSPRQPCTACHIGPSTADDCVIWRAACTGPGANQRNQKCAHRAQPDRRAGDPALRAADDSLADGPARVVGCVLTALGSSAGEREDLAHSLAGLFRSDLVAAAESAVHKAVLHMASGILLTVIP